MCGIAGVIDLASRRAAPTRVPRRMSDAVVHRGPDDDGYLDLPHLGLANRRSRRNAVLLARDRFGICPRPMPDRGPRTI